MKRVGEINEFDSSPLSLSQEEREKRRRAKIQQDKERGYQQLEELCYFGEYDAAKHLANRNSRWGYEIIDGIVVEREEWMGDW